MFRLQDHVPQNYINQSRDFQLFCRLYDYINNGIRFDIRSIIDLFNPEKCNDQMLNLYCTKVGFFHKIDIDTALLRNILKVFPEALKYKGTKKGIELAVGAVLKSETSSGTFDIIWPSSDDPDIRIYTSDELYNKKALDEVLRYIMPVGLNYSVSIRKTQELSTDLFNYSDSFTYLKGFSSSISQVRGDDRILGNDNPFNFKTDLEDDFVSVFDSIEVMGPETYTQENYTGIDRLGNNRNTVDKSDNFTDNTI